MPQQLTITGAGRKAPEVKRAPVARKYTDHEIPGTDIMMRRRVGESHALVPVVDESYSFRPELVEELAYSVATGQKVMLIGGAGTGKSSLVEQLAAQLNIPCRRVNVHGESDTTIFVGRDYPTVINGERQMVFQPGLLAEAMAEGHWFLVDEIDAALQPVLFVMQQVLEDDGKLVLEDAAGTVVRPHPDFRLFATANTVGIAGRNKLLYSGTNRLNEATLDRFGVVTHVPPMRAELETAVIQAKVPDLDALFVEAIVKIAGEVRGQLEHDEIACTFSTRRCIQWARAMTTFHPMRAAQMTVLNKLSMDDHEVLKGVIDRYFGG